MDLNQIVDELYALPPTEFTARRDQLAAESKKRGDGQLAAAVKALRRPSAAAFAMNLMARTRPDRIGALIDLGGRMKAAQEALSGDELRALGRQRSQLIHALTQEVRSVSNDAGHPVSDSVAREIESTLEAAFADAWAGEAVRQGRLVRGLERSGLGPADLEGAVAGGPSPPSEPAESKPARSSRAKAAEASEAADLAARTEARVSETATQLATAVAAHEAAVKGREEAEAAVRQLEHDLCHGRGAADDAAAAESGARDARRVAEQAHEEATREAARARASADSLKP